MLTDLRTAAGISSEARNVKCGRSPIHNLNVYDTSKAVKHLGYPKWGHT